MSLELSNASTAPLLVIGSKNYSSWSLRAWVFLRKAGFDFTEQVIRFDAPDYRAKIAAVSPSRRVPLLIDGQTRVWDSLAICEYVAECTGRGLPPLRAARALMRCVSAEMHSGFQTLREEWPMNIRATARQLPKTPGLLRDIARIDALWSDCRARHGSGGGWLFGEFSVADAMFVPVAFRFQTYGAHLGPVAAAYLKHVLEDERVREWQHAAMLEDHVLPEVDCIGSAEQPLASRAAP